MTLFAKIMATFGFGGLQNADTGLQSSGPGNAVTEAGIILSDERAMQVSAVWSCARLITETVGSLPLTVYQDVSNGREKVDRDHYLCQLFKHSPNVYMSPQEFREAMTLQLVLWGNAYALVDYIGNRPVSLIPLKPEFMTIHRSADGLIYHYQTTAGPVAYAARSIFHIKRVLGRWRYGFVATGLRPAGFGLNRSSRSVCVCTV